MTRPLTKCRRESCNAAFVLHIGGKCPHERHDENGSEWSIRTYGDADEKPRRLFVTAEHGGSVRVFDCRVTSNKPGARPFKLGTDATLEEIPAITDDLPWLIDALAKAFAVARGAVPEPQPSPRAIVQCPLCRGRDPRCPACSGKGLVLLTRDSDASEAAQPSPKRSCKLHEDCDAADFASKQACWLEADHEPHVAQPSEQRVTAEEARATVCMYEQQRVRLLAFIAQSERARNAIGKVLADNGCDCKCDHHFEEHEADCERCLACRIEDALKGGSNE